MFFCVCWFLVFILILFRVLFHYYRDTITASFEPPGLFLSAILFVDKDLGQNVHLVPFHFIEAHSYILCLSCVY